MARREVLRITLDGNKHEVPWHIVAAAIRMSFLAPGGSLVFFSDDYNDWASVSGSSVMAKYSDVKIQFHIIDGKYKDAAGNRLSGVRN